MTFVGALMALAACDDLPTAGFEVCTSELVTALRITVRDSLGQPAAIGAQVRIVAPDGEEEMIEGWGDSLSVRAKELGAGTFDVFVTRPWHTSAVVRDVTVPSDGCHPIRTDVAVQLGLLPDAPPVRQVVLPDYGHGFGWGNLTSQLIANVVAAPGITHEVTWLSRDESVATVSANGQVRSRCRSSYGSTWVLATSAVDASKSDSVHVSVWADNDPGRCPAAGP